MQPNLGVGDSHKIVPAVLRAVHRLYGKESCGRRRKASRKAKTKSSESVRAELLESLAFVQAAPSPDAVHLELPAT